MSEVQRTHDFLQKSSVQGRWVGVKMVAGGGAGRVEGSEKSFFPTVFKWHMKTRVLHADEATRKLAPSVRKNGVRGGQAHKNND